MIDVFDFAEVISDMVICHHNLSNMAITIENLSNIVVFYHNFSGLVVTNNSTLYLLRICHYYAMFYALDVVLLLRSICKPAILSKG